MIMFHRGVLIVAFNRLCEISCKNVDHYKEVLEGINNLCAKKDKLHELNINGNSKANDHVVGDPMNVKTKGAPKNKKLYIKPHKHNSYCRKVRHIIRRCQYLLELLL